MPKPPLPATKVTPQGVTVGDILIPWLTLQDALLAAAELCREGTRAHSDLVQAAVSHIPHVIREVTEQAAEDAAFTAPAAPPAKPTKRPVTDIRDRVYFAR